jgi:hypothetical protein
MTGCLQLKYNLKIKVSVSYVAVYISPMCALICVLLALDALVLWIGPVDTLEQGDGFQVMICPVVLP